MQKIQRRNSSIDLLKFLLSISIVMLHFGQNSGLELIPSAYLAVECFFMISGYFMMNSVSKAQGTDIGKDTLKFIGRKYSSFFLTLLFSALLAFSVTMFDSNLPSKTILRNFFGLITEIVPLQVTGIFNVAATGVAWYLSAMMLSMLVLYPLARLAGTKFTRVICPLFIAFIYGVVYAEYGHIDVIMDPMPGTPLYVGFFRGIAGICAGCMLYDCVKVTEFHRSTNFGKTLFLAVEFVCFGVVAVAMFLSAGSPTDFFVPIFMFVLLYSLFGRKSLISSHLSFKWSSHFSSASLLIYLNHNYWNFFLNEKFADLSHGKKFIFYLMLIVGSCLVVQAAVIITRRIWKKSKPVLKKHIVDASV